MKSFLQLLRELRLVRCVACDGTGRNRLITRFSCASCSGNGSVLTLNRDGNWADDADKFRPKPQL